MLSLRVRMNAKKQQKGQTVNLEAQAAKGGKPKSFKTQSGIETPASAALVATSCKASAVCFDRAEPGRFLPEPTRDAWNASTTGLITSNCANCSSNLPMSPTPLVHKSAPVKVLPSGSTNEKPSSVSQRICREVESNFLLIAAALAAKRTGWEGLPDGRGAGSFGTSELAGKP
jgi:hypothetical protein